jgi:hypothetical protein
MIKNIILLFLFFPLLAFAQDYAQLTISNIKVVDGTKTIENDKVVLVQLNEGKRKNDNILFAGSDITIEADIRVVAYDSKRSSSKSGAVKIKTVYFLNHGGKRDKRTTEQVFYLDDAREYQAKETFVIPNGLNSKKIVLTFKGKLDS